MVLFEQHITRRLLSDCHPLWDFNLQALEAKIQYDHVQRGSKIRGASVDKNYGCAGKRFLEVFHKNSFLLSIIAHSFPASKKPSCDGSGSFDFAKYKLRSYRSSLFICKIKAPLLSQPLSQKLESGAR
jgi:hypothetical protein